MNILFLTGLAVALGSASPPATAPDPKPAPSPPPQAIRVLSDVARIRILSDTTLPQAFDRAADVRWASDTSVYLSMGIDGAKEVSLDPAGPPPREMIPGNSKPGGFWGARHVAASSQYFAAAGQALVATWRHMADPAREEVPFDTIQDIDVQEGRFAIVGAQRSEDGLQFAPDGAIAWTGTFEKKLTDLRPLLYDSAGPGAANMARCGAAQLGAVRFLNEGSLVVVPGVQPGVNLYDRGGKLIRTWDSSSLGIDAACGTLTDLFQANKIMGPGAERNRWLNQWRTVDTLLPLPEGPGLVVRRVERGHTRWDLKLLRLDGTVLSIELPFEEPSEFFHLEGDVRDGKIVFVMRETVFRGGPKERPALPRLIVAETLASLAKQTKGE